MKIESNSLVNFLKSTFFKSVNRELQEEGKVNVWAPKQATWPWLLTALASKEPLLVILPARESYLLSIELSSWGNRVKILSSDSEDLESDLLNFLSLNKREREIYLATPDILLLPLISENLPSPLIVKGMQFPRDELVRFLQEKGFTKTFVVTQPKEFAVRGYILDIYNPVDRNILRLEYDEKNIIQDIRKVDSETQMTIERISSSKLKVGVVGGPRDSFFPFYKLIPQEYRIILLEDNDIQDELSLSIDDLKLNWSIRISSNKTNIPYIYLEAVEPLNLSQAKGEVVVITEYVNRLPEFDNKRVTVLRGRLRSGFRLIDPDVNVLSDNELFDIKLSPYPPPSKVSLFPRELLEGFERGKPVVHLNYGIGVFKGLKPVEIAGELGEYIELEYKNNDRLYIPFSQLHLIKRYSGSDTYNLSPLDKTEWVKIREKAVEKAGEVASKLLELYASRKLKEGYVFPENPIGEDEFIQGFPYEETPDQLKVIEEVKKDMASNKMMDRLICGDVGYGKTEIALRASYQAVMSGKQAAVLVPTTILAHQHYHLFKERFSPFPINIGILSRFVSQKEQNTTLENLKKGTLDIIIGTHRLLQKDVIFKDLGLLIIDEEHRFGVWQKEKIKEIKANLDTLSMSATPIPRTLQLAFKGIKDVSLLFTPPLGRLDAKIYCSPFNPSIVKEAIERELKRGGQVFYVHNRVKSIYKVGDMLKSLIGSVNIGIAHGQMNDKELEEILWKFYRGDLQVLLSTTIIESGIDIPRANTLIIDEAQNLGLSELYQLRGRVGRSNLKSYVYLFYSKASMTYEGEERLQAIVENSNLGSGFRLAMRDLEIRGAGNLYGHEQHGHIIRVGLDLFTEMVVEKMKGVTDKDGKKEEDVFVSSDRPAYLPGYYIEDEALRLFFYKKLSLCLSGEDLVLIKDELKDRFGLLPSEVINLLAILKLKIIAREVGAKGLIIKGKDVKLIFNRLIKKEDIFLLTGCKLIKGDSAYYSWEDLV